MQATRGFAGLGRHGRLVGCCTALVLALMALAGTSVASATPLPVKQAYLALGDSLAFGYSTQLYHEGEAAGFEDPESFEHGYVNKYYKTLAAKAKKESSGLRLINDGCPGETTAGFIGSNQALVKKLNEELSGLQAKEELPPIEGVSGNLSEFGPPNYQVPCEYQAAWNLYKTVGKGGPLHHPYSGSQLEDALATIAYMQNVEKKPVTTISLNIGDNDFLHAFKKIEAEVLAKVEKDKVVPAVELRLADELLAKLGKEAAEKYYGEHKEEVEKVGEEAVKAKIAEQVYIKCTEKAETESGEKTGETFENDRNNCLSTEGEKLGNEYYATHTAQLEKEGRQAGEKFIGEEVEAKLAQEGKEAAGKYYGEHKAEVEKVGEEAVQAKINEQVYIKCTEKAIAESGESKGKAFEEDREKCLATEGEKLGNEYYGEHKAQLEKEGQEAVEKFLGKKGEEAVNAKLKKYGEEYAAANKFALHDYGEVVFSELLPARWPGLFKQIDSNIAGIVEAIRNAGTLKLDGGKGVNYTGKIIFLGNFNSYGKQFHLAKEDEEFLAEHGGPEGPYKQLEARCEFHGNTEAEEVTRIANGCIQQQVFPFNGLVEILNGEEKTTVTGGFGVCFSDPRLAFNTNKQTEYEQMKKYVNMTNVTVTKVGSEEKPNGPDIHPTPAGYTELGKLMTTSTNGKCKKEGDTGF